MAETQKFEVEVAGNVVSAWDWVEAARVSKEELQKRGLSGRQALAEALAEERILSRAAELGRVVESVLGGLHGAYRLVGLVAEPEKQRWLLRVQTEKGLARVAVGEALADDVVDSGALQDLDRLKEHLREWLTRTDLIAPGG
jgi:hypothetical protein